MATNTYRTYVAYRDNNSWTSERGASKFFSEIITQGSLGKGDKGCVYDGFYVQPSTAMTVQIAMKAPGETNSEGHCMVSYNDYAFMGWQEGNYNLTLGGSSQTLSRISYIVAYIDLDVEFQEKDNVVESPSVLKFVEVKGNNAATPTAPTQTQIKAVVGQNNPYIILAEVSVPTNTSTITSSLITDRRIKPKISKNLQLEDSSGIYVAGIQQTNGKKMRIQVIGSADPWPANPTNNDEQILVIQMRTGSGTTSA